MVHIVIKYASDIYSTTQKKVCLLLCVHNYVSLYLAQRLYKMQEVYTISDLAIVSIWLCGHQGIASHETNIFLYSKVD